MEEGSEPDLTENPPVSGNRPDQLRAAEMSIPSSLSSLTPDIEARARNVLGLGGIGAVPSALPPRA